MTDYYLLYQCHALPLEEAYYLAEFNYRITKDPDVRAMINSLRNMICNMFVGLSVNALSEQECCRRFMDEKGYIVYSSPNVYRPISDAYENCYRPEDQQITNTIDYLQLYKDGLISLVEVYVLAKNKQNLLGDDSMQAMIFDIEELMLEEIINYYRYDDKTDYKSLFKTYLYNHCFKFDEQEGNVLVPDI